MSTSRVDHFLRRHQNRIAALAAVFIVAAAGPGQALNVALTNDDGWDAPGIQTLRAALVAEGHTVTLAGPAGNQSGSSAAIDLGLGNLLVTKEVEDGNPGGSDQYSVALAAGGGAEPATAGLIAISIAEQVGGPVDLLISGTNAGANIGAFTNVSGTVGAAIHGVSLVSGESIPSIAISTDEPSPLRNCGGDPDCIEESEAENLEQFERVAAWAAEFVALLETKPGLLKHEAGLLPTGVALNINHPIGEPAGTKLRLQSPLPSVAGSIRGLPLGCYADCASLPEGASAPAGIAGSAPVDQDDVKHSDVEGYNEGFIVIVPIEANLDASLLNRIKVLGLAPPPF